jgi:probable selenium-dependent hydroxylase accessory protein YqeC
VSDLFAAFLLAERRHVQLVGGGGKTTLMLGLAAALRQRGAPVLVGTTTHIRDPEHCPVFVLEADPERRRCAAARALAQYGWACVAAGREPETGKLRGLAAGEPDALYAALPSAWMLIEADGSRGLPLKAHEVHEPVLSPGVELVIAVVGLSALGRPLDDRTVHRPRLLAARLGVPLGTPLGVDLLACAAVDLLAKAPPAAARLVFVAQAGSADGSRARDLATRILAAGAGIRRVVWGDLTPPVAPLSWLDAAEGPP